MTAQQYKEIGIINFSFALQKGKRSSHASPMHFKLRETWKNHKVRNPFGILRALRPHLNQTFSFLSKKNQDWKLLSHTHFFCDSTKSYRKITLSQSQWCKGNCSVLLKNQLGEAGARLCEQLTLHPLLVPPDQTFF